MTDKEPSHLNGEGLAGIKLGSLKIRVPSLRNGMDLARHVAENSHVGEAIDRLHSMGRHVAVRGGVNEVEIVAAEEEGHIGERVHEKDLANALQDGNIRGPYRRYAIMAVALGAIVIGGGLYVLKNKLGNPDGDSSLLDPYRVSEVTPNQGSLLKSIDEEAQKGKPAHSGDTSLIDVATAMREQLTKGNGVWIKENRDNRVMVLSPIFGKSETGNGLQVTGTHLRVFDPGSEGAVVTHKTRIAHFEFGKDTRGDFGLYAKDGEIVFHTPLTDGKRSFSVGAILPPSKVKEEDKVKVDKPPLPRPQLLFKN